MKLDANRAWQEASAMVSANRDVLLAVAGVFLVLPSLAVALLFPAPEIGSDLPPRAIYALYLEYFRSVALWEVLSALIASVGVLAMLRLLTDRDRPTVGAAIGEGVRCFPTYIGTMLISALLFGIGLLLVALAVAGTQSPAIAFILGVPVLATLMYISIRWNLAAPVIAIEQERNPISVLQRSWKLTEGNAGRIFVFLLLLAIVYLVILLIGVGVLGGIAALALGEEAAILVSALIGALLGGTFSVFITASLAAIHRQLSGQAGDIASRFD